MSESASETIVAIEPLKDLVFRILARNNVPEDEADLLADALVTADARGMNSHGVMRLPIYLSRIRSGGAIPGKKGTILKETAGTVLLDGEDGIGHVIANRAMDEAMRKAREAGVGVVGVTRSNHFGEAAYYVQKATRQNMIGLMATNGSPNMPVWGGMTKLTGPHAFAVAIPTGEAVPVVLDMSWGVVSKGKILYAAKKGESIPLGWGVDKMGNPTEDPQAVADGGWALPIGGYKGWGLIFVFEVLSGVLTGGRIIKEISDLYGDQAAPQGLGHFIMALDIEAFVPIEQFKQRLDYFIETIKSSELAPGFDEILTPGEREFRLETKRRNEGIPLTADILEPLRELAADAGVPFTIEAQPAVAS